MVDRFIFVAGKHQLWLRRLLAVGRERDLKVEFAVVDDGRVAQGSDGLVGRDWCVVQCFEGYVGEI